QSARVPKEPARRQYLWRFKAFLSTIDTDTSLELVGNLLDACLCAGLFLRLSADRAAQADAANRIFADIDGHSAAERNDLRKHPLPGICGLGALRPFRGGLPERASRVSLAAGKLDVVRIGVIALEENTQPAGAVDDRHRGRGAAFRERRFR